MEDCIKDIVKLLMEEKELTRKKVWNITKSTCKRHNMDTMPTNVQILQACNEKERSVLKGVLMSKPVRTSSGVSVITVVPKPSNCPGNCIYCPNTENVPKSYIGTEPAIMRAVHNKYSSYGQVKNRLEQYRLMGHPTDKVQIVIIGGTFLSLDKEYKKDFIKGVFDALNGKVSEDLETAKMLNETADNRCIGLIIETRPDFCKEDHINEMLDYGTTMVEIGVQSIYPEILELTNRMHTIEDVKKATRLAKDAGLKVNYHVMIGLPESTRDMDITQMEKIFKDESFKPDALKIYPTLVVKGTGLYDMWKNGSYKPLDTKEATDIIVECMKHVPKYCRVVRMQRTMAINEIEDGVKKSNLREVVEKEAERIGVDIKEIRYREVGRSWNSGKGEVKLNRMEYDASGGKEIFLSFEDNKNNVLFGFLRLRIPEGDAAIVRELHVYGSLVKIGDFNNDSHQHKGLGSKLLKEAERISKEFGKKKIMVISGIGAREYYYKKGYKIDNPYVSKPLD